MVLIIILIIVAVVVVDDIPHSDGARGDRRYAICFATHANCDGCKVITTITTTRDFHGVF